MPLALLLWLFCQPIIALSQQPTPLPKPPVQRTKPDQQRPQPQERGSQESPFVVELDSIQANQQTAQAQRESDEQAATASRVAWLTGGLLLIALVQAVLFLWQLKMIRRSLTDTKMAADAAQQAAQATQASVALAKDTAERQLRAYLSRNGKEPHSELPDAEGTLFEFRLRFRNNGQTPAYDVRVTHGGPFFRCHSLRT